MQSNDIPYKRSIFVCTNDQKGEKPSCGDHQGEAVFRELRNIAKARGHHPTIRVAQAKCLGQCNRGVNIMIYPENVWLDGIRMEDVGSIADRYLPTEKNH